MTMKASVVWVKIGLHLGLVGPPDSVAFCFFRCEIRGAMR